VREDKNRIIIYQHHHITMKYLQDEKLNEISSELSEAVLKDSHRIIQGRIEAYIMTRSGNDKKYAYALGQKYIAEIEDMHEELAATVERKKRRRSNSESFLSTLQSITSSSSNGDNSDDNTALNNKKSKVALSSSNTSITTSTDTTMNLDGRRSRARSFDCTLDSISPKTTLGDFLESSTRKLMTDLILTLNASFPDYDFSNVKPNQFQKLRMDDVRKSIYEKLSEFASQRSSPNFLVDLWYAVNDVINLSESDCYSFEYEFDNEDSLWNFHYLFVNKSVRRIIFFTCSERIDCNDDEMICRDDGQLLVQEGDESFRQVRYYSTPETQSVSDDVDWDPSDNVAGGMSMELIL